MAGVRRGAGFGGARPRLERARHRRVLRAEYRGARARPGEQDPRHHEQLRADLVQRRTDADGVARTRGPRGGGGEDRGGGSRERRGARRPRQRAGAGLQPHDHAARVAPRQGDAGALGHRGLSASLRPRAGRHVAAGNRGRRRVTRGPGGGRPHVHDSGAASGRARPAARRRRARVDRRRRRHRSQSRLSLARRQRSAARDLLLRRADLTCHRVRGHPAQRARPRCPPAGRVLRRARLAAARPLRDRRRVVRPPQPLR